MEFPYSRTYLESVLPDLFVTTQETTQQRIVALLKKEPSLTRKLLAERIGISPDGVKYHLDKLRDTGKIRHVGSTKKGHWEILEEPNE
ncbi:MAG: winged helix-turn-helix transcriptional regulator [Verrucomicrobia bacterium]|nr:winged helix-turn-helix transcriptional regulator [Verrucomicrobiota bacterium]